MRSFKTRKRGIFHRENKLIPKGIFRSPQVDDNSFAAECYCPVDATALPAPFDLVSSEESFANRQQNVIFLNVNRFSTHWQPKTFPIAQ